MFGQDGKWICEKHGVVAEWRFDANGQLVNDLTMQVCPTCEEVRERSLCIDCEEHPASITFSESLMDTLHGGTRAICRCCYMRRIEKHLEDVKRNLQQAKLDLEANPCLTSVPVETPEENLG